VTPERARQLWRGGGERMNLSDGVFGALVNFLYLMLMVSLLLAFIRLAVGPSMPDRVVALDLIANLVVATTALYAITTNQQVLLDVAIGIALITFLGTVAFAQYIERRARND
jgi:multicomponent Na+:H+ antiporter subunit F